MFLTFLTIILINLIKKTRNIHMLMKTERPNNTTLYNTYLNYYNENFIYLQGYTPLHIAMQFRHENVYKLLVDVYSK